MKKKILVVSLSYFPYVGGAEVAIKEIFDRFDKEKYDVEVLTCRFDKKNKRTEKFGNIKVTRLGIGNTKIDKLFFPFFLLKESIGKKYDLVFSSCMNHAAVATNLVYFFKKKPVIMNVQDGFKESEAKELLGMFYFLYDKSYNKNFYYQCISKDLANRCIKHKIPKKQIRLIPNGVDLDIFLKDIKDDEKDELRKKYNIKKSDKVIITTSRLTKKNALDDVIKSLPYLDKKVKFLICGTGEDEDKLKSLARYLQVEDRVIFAGKIDYHKLPLYLSISDIFIRPSLYEGLGNSFIESMAAGIPIIGTKVGGIPDFLTDNETGLFVKVKNPKDISEKITLLLGDKKLYNNIKKQGKVLAIENYSWDKISMECEDFINEVLI